MAQHVEVVSLITPSPEPEPALKRVPFAVKAHNAGTYGTEKVEKDTNDQVNSVKETHHHVEYERPVYQSIESNGIPLAKPTPSPKKGSLVGLLQLVETEQECEASRSGRKRRLSTPSEIAYRPCPKQHRRVKHSELESLQHTVSASPAPITTSPIKVSQGHEQYSEEENALLYRLKVIDNRSWKEIEHYFPNRSRGALQGHFSTKVKNFLKGTQAYPRATRKTLVTQTKTKKAPGRPRRDDKRDGGSSAVDGFISWKDVDARIIDEVLTEVKRPERHAPIFPYDHIAPMNLARHLRQRELGRQGPTRMPEEMVNHSYAKYRLRKSFSPTCGDVNALAWSPDLRSKGTPLRFAAASIAISDNRNMQYNGGLNLLVGDYEKQTLQELPDHRVERPVVNHDLSNANSLQDMRNTQDANLYKTVNAIAFSSCATRLFSVSDDSTLRSYRFKPRDAVLEHTISHPAPISLMSVNSDDMVATASKTSERTCIQIHHFQGASAMKVREMTVDVSKFLPAALCFGLTSWRKQYLLAGFSGDGYERDSLSAGATYLWDTHCDINLGKIGHTPNVFQIAWNPIPSSASPWFCVASAPPKTLGKATRSVVQCFGPAKTSAVRELITFECGARDINELTYCQHDPALIAAGGTDGRVYVWDARFVRRTQHPLHVLGHGDTVQVLDHDRDPEEANTGIGFLSWGATSSRLYSGSSNGTVKVWNPRRATENALVDDLVRFPTAIMSGSFSPDYRDLLIGEECGRLNLLSVGNQSPVEGSRVPFKLQRAPADEKPTASEVNKEAAELLTTGQIEIRLMGNMPIRQAVQGRNYTGPFFKPSMKAWNEAQTAYDSARSHIEAAIEPETKLEEAKKQLQAAEHMLSDYRARETDWPQLESEAIAKQRAWALQEPPQPIPRPTSIPNIPQDLTIREMDSAQRIPYTLRRLPRKPLDVRGLTCKQLYDMSLASKCTDCEKADQTKSKRQKAHYRNLCKARRVRVVGMLSGGCRDCGAPVQNQDITPSASTDGDGRGGGQGRCVRCGFHCVRCGEEAELSASTSTLTCGKCELVWSVDVLGYSLDDSGKGNKERTKSRKKEDDEDDEEVMDSHFDHLWTLWGT